MGTMTDLILKPSKPPPTPPAPSHTPRGISGSFRRFAIIKKAHWGTMPPPPLGALSNSPIPLIRGGATRSNYLPRHLVGVARARARYTSFGHAYLRATACTYVLALVSCALMGAARLTRAVAKGLRPLLLGRGSPAPCSLKAAPCGRTAPRRSRLWHIGSRGLCPLHIFCRLTRCASAPAKEHSIPAGTWQGARIVLSFSGALIYSLMLIGEPPTITAPSVPCGGSICTHYVSASPRTMFPHSLRAPMQVQPRPAPALPVRSSLAYPTKSRHAQRGARSGCAPAHPLFAGPSLGRHSRGDK